MTEELFQTKKINIIGGEILRKLTATISYSSSVGMDDLNDMKMFVAN